MPQAVEGSLWFYAPNKAAPIVFAVLFGISGLLHIWQNVLRYRSWRIGFLLPWASLIFTAGYALREYGAYHYGNLGIFIASTVLLFVAPPTYNGADYFIFGRALYYLPYLAPIHPGRVWSTFITLDTIDGILAGNGAARAANTSISKSERNTGFILVKASLILLLAMFLGFFSLIVIFHQRIRKHKLMNHKTKVIIYELYASSFLILIRNCFRTASFFFPEDSVANGKEWPYWVFEAVPMVLNTYMMNVWPPAKYLPANHKIYLAMDGKTELEGPGMVDRRTFLLTLFDPFDIGGLITGRDNKNKYWEKDGIGGPKEEHAGEVSSTTLETEHGK